MFNRRHFLRHSGVISLSPLLPTFLDKTIFATESPQADDGRILVVLQLDGGNDGINTVVPRKDEGYARHRRELRLPDHDLIRLTDEIALHPRLRSASELYEDGRLSIVHGVGYPNPNRSHFESMTIWQAGGIEERVRRAGNGWIGAAVNRQTGTDGPQAIHVGTETLPVALRGRRCNAMTISSAADVQLRSDAVAHDVSVHTDVGTDLNPPTNADSLHEFVTKSVSDAYRSARELAAATKADGAASYPDTPLAGRLKLVSQVIKSGAAARAYYVVQEGYDTHAAQLMTHAILLRDLSASLKAFMDDLRESKLDDRVLVMAFSEFGRRVSENDSQGTDHGTAGPVFLAGTKLAQPTFGQVPSLTDLEDGDLKFGIDFRDIYTAILAEWLTLDVPGTLQEFRSNWLFSSSG